MAIPPGEALTVKPKEGRRKKKKAITRDDVAEAIRAYRKAGGLINRLPPEKNQPRHGVELKSVNRLGPCEETNFDASLLISI